MSEGPTNQVVPGVEAPWGAALMPATGTVRQAIRNLQETGLQISLVLDPNGALVGTVTDGDVRRGLLRGRELESPVDSIMMREPLVVPAGLSEAAALQLMKANVIGALPVVDTDRRVVGLHLLRGLLAPDLHLNLMVIMAGGKGARLQPHTNDCPKPLIPVGDKPMLEHIIERARAEGFNRFVLAVHYLAEMVEEYFGDGGRWDVEINYLRENSPLGTAGAIGLLSPKPTAPFLVSNCDVMTDVRYSEILDFHCRHDAAATMAVRLHEWQHPFGVVRTEGVDILSFEEKPISRTRINAGVYVLEPDSLDVLEEGVPCDMPTLFNRIKGRGERTIVFPMHEPWLDVGHVGDLERAQADHANGQSPQGVSERG